MRRFFVAAAVLVALVLAISCAKKQEAQQEQQQPAKATTEVQQLNKCVVCGMEIPAEADTITAEYNGVVYHFCSPQDKEKFLANPEMYVKAKGDTTQKTEM
ncbi:MAG: YHS domain-containing protein [Calditrichaeota bacterium]|nr:YHS domain-containing protein [Calditrichota bacterium]